jgi:shikimate dehydrogenase
LKLWWQAVRWASFLIAPNLGRSYRQELAAVLGQPVDENPTQAMIEAAFAHHGLAWRYLTIEVAPADLGAAVEGARAMGFRGFNCTIPHKLTVVPHLDLLGESARRIGAVNTVVRRGDQLVGENTDGKGFVESLRTVTDPKGTRVVILGAGGAARAIAVELALAGAARLTMVSRRPREIPAEAELVIWDGDYAVPSDTDVLVNATPIGLYPDADARVPVDPETFPEIVADVIPNPPETRLLREAKARGRTTLDGLGMLVAQGAIGFELWTGVQPDQAVMRDALMDLATSRP